MTWWLPLMRCRRETSGLESPHGPPSAADRQASGHSLSSDRQVPYLGLDVVRDFPPFFTIHFQHDLDRFASIGHRLVSRVSLGHDFGQRRHQRPCNRPRAADEG